MEDQELKRLNRFELIDIIYRLRLEAAELEQRLEETTQRLEEKNIMINNSGSVASAALALNGVFEAAQEAADQYLLSVKSSYKKVEEQIQKTKRQCEELLLEVQAEADNIRRRAEKESAERLAAADKDCRKRYELFQVKLNQYFMEHPEARTMLINQQRKE